MTNRKPWAILASALLALATACTAPGSTPAAPGGSGSGGGGATGSITIGIKFDQPGLGLKDGNAYTGFDVEVAKYVAKELGYSDSQITWKESPSAQRETLIEGGQVQLIFATYSITDARKQRVSFGGPYFIAGQDLLVRTDDTAITGPDALNGKKLCSVTGSTSAKNVKDKYATGVDLIEQDTYSKCVSALASGTLDAVTTDNVILAGYAAQDQYKGKLKVVGKSFSTERYGVGLKKGDTALCTKVNTAITKMVSSGDWKKALDKTVGPSGFMPSSANPPTPDACA
jgi:glutamate transport system substrate-binding protein